jgi:hypothetical protein
VKLIQIMLKPARANTPTICLALSRSSAPKLAHARVAAQAPERLGKQEFSGQGGPLDPEIGDVVV